MNKRELRGFELLKLAGSIKPVNNENAFMVRSESKEGLEYRVEWKNGKWTCECEDFVKRRKKCKHVWCVIYWLALKRLNAILKSEFIGNTCPKCGSSENVVKRGIRYNLSGPKQVYYCNYCKKAFTERTPFSKMKNHATVILVALDLYFKGLSLRKVQDHLRQFYGADVHHTTILKWVRKYSKLIGTYLQELEIEFGDRWNSDETIIRISGRDMRLWALMDSETRLLVAHKLSEKRTAEEAEELFQKGIANAKKIPHEIVTDGFNGYPKAIESLLQKHGNKPEGIIHIFGPLTGEINNNLVERLFGELKQRASQMRGVKSKDSFAEFMEGYLALYNISKLNKEISILPIIEKAYYITEKNKTSRLPSTCFSKRKNDDGK